VDYLRHPPFTFTATNQRTTTLKETGSGGNFSKPEYCIAEYSEQRAPRTAQKPTGHVIHHQFNSQQLYALPTLYLCVLYLSDNKQRLVPLTAKTDWFL
jgi:hypothetical protein